MYMAVVSEKSLTAVQVAAGRNFPTVVVFGHAETVIQETLQTVACEVGSAVAFATASPRLAQYCFLSSIVLGHIEAVEEENRSGAVSDIVELVE